MIRRSFSCLDRTLARRGRFHFTTQAAEGQPSQCTVVQLKTLLRDYGLPASGKKADLVSRLSQHLDTQKQQKEEKQQQVSDPISAPQITTGDYEELELEELKGECRKRGLIVSGAQSDLRIRLQVDDKSQERLGFSITPELKQSVNLKSPERLRFEQDTKHLLEKAIFVRDDTKDEITLSAAKFASLADGVSIATSGDTSMMVTACCKREQNSDFDDGVHLMLDYREKGWAKGYIPSGMFRWEGTPSTPEILIMRVVDRSLRPLFPKNFPHQVQVIGTLLSHDSYNESICLTINAASAALCMSGIPFHGPIAAVRIGSVKGRLVVNPKVYELEQGDFDLLYVSTRDKVVMLEFGGKPVSEERMIEALRLAKDSTLPLIEAQERLAAKHSKRPLDLPPSELDLDVFSVVSERIRPLLDASFANPNLTKRERGEEIYQIRQEIKEYVAETLPDCSSKDVNESIYQCEHDSFRDFVFTHDVRIDGRDFTDLRQLDSYVDVLPVSHGSSFFSRGETQTLCSITLGPHHLSRMRCLTDAGHPLKQHRLFVSYEMPPFATNEVNGRKVGGRGRREQGHGELACKALENVLPTFEKFPHSIRLVSNITASNGSSSMATVCGGTAALLDAGVPIEPTVGISVGLLTREDGNTITDYRLLTDIAGIEDHLGDMDFKIASTDNGITAMQLDMKVKGVPLSILEEALYQAKQTRPALLAAVTKDLQKARPSIKHNAPLVEIMRLPAKKIAKIIGTGGHVIRDIQKESGAELDTDLDNDKLEICATNARAMEHAKRLVQNIVGLRHESGDLITVTVIAIVNGKGAVVASDDEREHFIPEGHFYMPHETPDVVSTGDKIEVMFMDRVGNNTMELSRRAAILSKSEDPTDRANYLLLLRHTAKQRQLGILQGARATPGRQQPTSRGTHQVPSTVITPRLEQFDSPPKSWPWMDKSQPKDGDKAIDTILDKLKEISSQTGMESVTAPPSKREVPENLEETMDEILSKLKTIGI